jgi:hypothetical protein
MKMPVAMVVQNQVRDAGVPVISVSIGSRNDKSTWTVQPDSLQAAAQPIIDAYNIPAEDLAWQWYIVRTQRDTLLYGCDWTQASDSPLTAAEQADWRIYRQALRDVPEKQTDPYAVVWPVPPFVIDPIPV